MKIDVRSGHVMYVEIDDYIFYIDFSTEEPIIDKWHKYNKPK